MTLNRYENGSLQDDAHDRALRLIDEPSNLQKLIEINPNAGTPNRLQEVLKRIRELDNEIHSLFTILIQGLSNYPPSMLSGYKTLDIYKFFNAVLYFCKEGLSKTSLNKYLFYMDFKYYKE